MLTRITIKNLALIRDLEIEFSDGLNVFTGETGAGKSIIVDSLMLLIGARYDKSLLKYGEEKGYVEGLFECDCRAAESFGIDCEDGILIVSRKFFKDGRNEIRVNGKQITTSMLREIMTAYVDIYGQNEYQSLLKVSEQRKILDYYVFGKDSAPLDNQRELYNEYKKLRSDMLSLGDERARAQRIDILEYQIGEIERAEIKEGEEQELVDFRHVLMSAERIKNALGMCFSALESDEGACSTVSDALRDLSQISSLDNSYQTLYDRLKSVSIELDDIAESVKDGLDGMSASEAELDKIELRLEKIRSIKSKYGAFDAMTKFLENARHELDRAKNGAEEYAELCKKEAELKNKLFASCNTLSDMRRDGAKSMGKRIVEELSDLGMQGSKFEVMFSDKPTEADFTDKVDGTGFDQCEFYLSPNAGQPLMPLAKIISGGEMSRFMLSIKLITGDLGDIDTMIFDEIDTGISGAVGLGVAKKLCKLSRSRQVLCVTHLPQIAAMADSHFFIEKHDVDGETVTSVTPLDRKGKIGEIARLSGTKGVSATSDKNAEEMKDWSDGFKKSL